MRYFLIIIIPLLYLSACTHKEVNTDNTSKILDSALNIHLEARFGNPYQDTLDRENKILLAYYQKNTDYLLEYLKDVAKWKKEEEQIDSTERPFIKQTELYQLGVDEGYRFMYARSFSPYYIYLTITRKDDKYNLEVHILKTFYYRDDNLFSGGNHVNVNAISRWSAENEAIFKAYLSTLKLARIRHPYHYWFTGAETV